MAQDNASVYYSAEFRGTRGSASQQIREDEDIDGLLCSSNGPRELKMPMEPLLPFSSNMANTYYAETTRATPMTMPSSGSEYINTEAFGWASWDDVPSITPTGWQQPCVSSTSYGITNSHLDMGYDPPPHPIDSFASLATYPYALERLPAAPSWSAPGDVASSQAPFLLYPSSAHNVSSTELLMEESVLPIAYDPQAVRSAAYRTTNARSAAKQTGKRVRTSLSPQPGIGDVLDRRATTERLSPSDKATKRKASTRKKRVKIERVTLPMLQESSSQEIVSQDRMPSPSQPLLNALPIALRGKTPPSFVHAAAAYEDERRSARSEPLLEGQRERMDAVRYQGGACWRCRRYKKPVFRALHLSKIATKAEQSAMPGQQSVITVSHQD
ncbi:MAG: hypothetical protein MMC23_007771 [Stictis urceolatum]|nr:hypothetical protein [Stictis urceolata]